MKHVLGSITVIAVILGSSAAGQDAVERGEAVSPGDLHTILSVGSGTPSFSWVGSRDASSYQLAVFSLSSDLGEVPGNVSIVLNRVLPARSLSWTPSLEERLAPGDYAWFVRPLSPGEQDESPWLADNWSRPMLFRVVGERQAVGPDVGRELSSKTPSPIPGFSRRSGAAEGSAELTPVVPLDHLAVRSPLLVTPEATGLRSDTTAGTGSSFAVHGVSTTTGGGSAGVVGQSTALTGETAGVIGQVASPAGSAAIFDNTGGGDLIRGLASGLERFRIEGSGAVTATSYSGDGSALTNVSATALATGTYPNTLTFSNGGNSFTGDGSSLSGVVASGLQAGTYSSAVTFNNGGNSFSGDGSNLTGISASDPTRVSKAGDTMTGELTMSAAGVTFGDSSTRIFRIGGDLVIEATSTSTSDLVLEAEDFVEIETNEGEISLQSADDIEMFVGPGNVVELNGSLIHSSDRNLKTDLEQVDPVEVLSLLSSMDVFFWRFKDDPHGTRHLGPMAQDFFSAFELGRDERYIASTDADGVALAAIQGLLEEIRLRDIRIQELESRMTRLESAMRDR